MAKKIIWSVEAQRNLNDIIEYWNEKNKNNDYSKKLVSEFKKISSLISIFPHSGKETDYKNIRAFIKGHFSIYYYDSKDYINIVHIWDNRRNPNDLNIK